MIPLWQACILTVVFMAAQDTFATSMVVAEARNLAVWPGALDAANDWVSRAGAAVTSGAYVKYGLWDWRTQLILALTMLTSFSTTNTVTPLASALLPARRVSHRSLRRHRFTMIYAEIEAIKRHVGIPLEEPA